MNVWQKVSLILIVAAFPGGLALMRAVDKHHTSSLFKDAEAAIQAKAAELSHMDLKIMTAQGELLKYQGRRLVMLSQRAAVCSCACGAMMTEPGVRLKRCHVE